ncbi:hypothetical protein Hanom_Chr08g00752561 [Helianthus anomalus]
MKKWDLGGGGRGPIAHEKLRQCLFGKERQMNTISGGWWLSGSDGGW